MNKHSPGPWKFERDEDIPHYRLIRDDANAVLMGDPEFYPWCPPSDADWQLIAAAPELLAAVECADAYELRDDWREVLTRHGWSEDEMVASIFIRKLRRIALSKAKP